MAKSATKSAKPKKKNKTSGKKKPAPVHRAYDGT
jgi:hypothetical protein